MVRKYGWSVALAAAVVGLMVSQSWPHSFFGIFSDSISYIRIATSLSPFARPDALSAAVSQTTHFPPGYPFVIGMFGGTHEHLQWAWGIHCALFAVTSVIVATFLRREIPGPLAAIAATLIVVLSPVWLVSGLRLSSEPLFTSILLIGLMLANERKVRSAALVLGLACLVRAIGVVVLPALALWLVSDRSRRRDALPAIVLAGAPYAVLSLVRSFGAENLDYVSDLGVVVQAIANGYGLEFLLQQATAFASAFSLSLSPSTGSVVAGAAIAMCLIPGWLRRLRMGRLDAFVLPPYLMLIAIWPYPADMPRFVAPVVPLLLICVPDTLRYLRRFRGAAATVLAAWPAFVIAAGIYRLAFPVPAELMPYKVAAAYFTAQNQEKAVEALLVMKSFEAALRAVPQAVPPEECVYGAMPELGGFYSGRRFVAAEASTGQTLVQSDSFAQCRFFFVSLLGPAQGNRPAYHPLQLVDSVTDQVFFTSFERDAGTVLSAALLVKRENRESTDR